MKRYIPLKEDVQKDNLTFFKNKEDDKLIRLYPEDGLTGLDNTLLATEIIIKLYSSSEKEFKKFTFPILKAKISNYCIKYKKKIYPVLFNKRYKYLYIVIENDYETI
jgi:hypothetical protein